MSGHGDSPDPACSLPPLANHEANHKLSFGVSQQYITLRKRLDPLKASRPKSCASGGYKGTENKT